MAEKRLYPTGMVPDFPNESDGTPSRILGTVFYSDDPTFAVALEWFAPLDLPSFCDITIWALDGDDPLALTGSRATSDLLTFNVGTMTPGAWNRLNLPTPRFMNTGQPRLVQVHTDGHYVYSAPGDFPFDNDDGTLHAYAALDAGNGRWTNSGDNDDIAGTNIPGGVGYNFFVNVITDDNPAPARTASLSIVLPPLGLALTADADATASLNIALPAIDVDLEADAIASAALSIALPPIDVDLTADADVSASLAIVLPAPQVALGVGADATASLNISLPAIQTSLEVDPVATVLLSILLPAMSMSLGTGEQVNPANLREYVWELLRSDSVLNGYGINEASCFGTNAPDSPSADLQRWVVIRWGIEETPPGRDTTSRRRFLSVWAYDRNPDYSYIDLILDRCREILYPLKAVNYNNSGGYVTEVMDNGYSEDVWDDAYSASTKNWQLTIVASGR